MQGLELNLASTFLMDARSTGSPIIAEEAKPISRSISAFRLNDTLKLGKVMPRFFQVEFFNSDGSLAHNAIASAEQAATISQGRRVVFGQVVPEHEVANLTMEERGMPEMQDDFPLGLPEVSVEAHSYSDGLNGYEFATYKKWLANYAKPEQENRISNVPGDVVMFSPHDEADGLLLRGETVDHCIAQAKEMELIPMTDEPSSPAA